MKPFETTSLQIKNLLEEEVARRCWSGSSQDTIQRHRLTVLHQVAEWLNISDALETNRDEMEREHLVKLLLKDTRKTIKNTKLLPQSEAEWSQLLHHWLRHNTLQNNQDVIDRRVYCLLAVDGFEGFQARDLKSYLSNIVDPDCIRREYRIHIRAIRKMYEWFDSQSHVSSLIGTDTGCVIFLSLLKLYNDQLQKVLVDDQIAMQTHQARMWAEGFLHRNATHYRDMKKITKELLAELGQVYVNAWDGQDWTTLGEEQLLNLMRKKV